MKTIMKALRPKNRLNKHFPLLRQTAILFFCFSAFIFPLFGQENAEELTQALKKEISKYSDDKIDIEGINRLLDAGADPNGLYDTWMCETFLIHAAQSRNVQLARILLDHGADPNLWRTDGRWSTGPKIRIPVFFGNGEITALFIAHGARFDVVDEYGISALMSQTRNYESSAILILEWEQRHSPGFSAGFENRKDYLTAVLARLLDRFYFPIDDRTEIYTLAERLIDAGANPAAMHKDGFPVAYLAVNGSSDAQFIIPLLFERGTPVDALNKNGQTAIYCAVAAENFELASLLLKKGADINQQNNSGRTSLMAASSEKMMSFLLERGANPNIQDSDGKTALMDCGGKTEIIHLLFHAGANPTLKDNKGRTVLHYWISDLDGPMIDDLISRGLLIDEPDNEGRTPLISAIDRSRRVTLLLLEKGADPNYRGPKGRTALHFYLLDIENQYRYKSENIERDQPVITALLEAGTRPADKDDDGDSALITAFRIAQKDKNTTTLTDLVQRYADAEEIKIATDTARKMISTEKREYRREELSENLPPTIKALSVPLILGGLGFVMRSVVFKNNPSDNIMGLLNGMLTLGGVGATLGFFLGVASYKGSGVWNDMFGPAVNGVIGGIIGGVAGIIVACLPSVRKAFTNNQVLYYTPTAVSAVTVSVIIFHIWN